MAKSDATRIETLHEVGERITPISLIFGNGLGVGVPIRPEHMEISYIEIFHKQGLLGSIWWASMFILLLMRYRKSRRIKYQYAQPLLLSALFVAFESATNNFVNNPIGIFVWITALVCLDVIAKNDSPATFPEGRELSAH